MYTHTHTQTAQTVHLLPGAGLFQRSATASVTMLMHEVAVCFQCATQRCSSWHWWFQTVNIHGLHVHRCSCKWNHTPGRPSGVMHRMNIYLVPCPKYITSSAEALTQNSWSLRLLLTDTILFRPSWSRFLNKLFLCAESRADCRLQEEIL